jgi:Nif-specific regulatory protein
MTTVRDVSALQELIVKEGKMLMGVDRVSVFLFDRERCELWSIISQENKVMRLDARLGIAGKVAMTGETINVADAYEHPLFYKEIDLETGYRTRTLLAVPLRNLKREVIGVCEAINKNEGTFNDEDIEILETLAAHAADAFETTQFRKLIEAENSVPLGRDRGYPQCRFSTQNIIGMSHRTQAIIRLIDQIRNSSVDVLIQGESGTGKELVAKALHYNSPRAEGSFVALNCAALPDNLVEAELFGIEKGVATGVDHRIGKFEQATGGTLFLDEVGDLSLAAQAKILRVLQERAVDRIGGKKPTAIDVRVIAATNKDLEAAIKERTFRADLYFRLKVVYVQTPPLRDVPEDIPLLATHFLARYCAEAQTELKEFTPAALRCLTRYPWPGNTRELENEVKRLVASVRGKSIDEAHLDVLIRSLRRDNVEAAEEIVSNRSLPAALEQLERRLIDEALRECGGNKQKAAQVLGLSRQGLIKKLKRLGITGLAVGLIALICLLNNSRVQSIHGNVQKRLSSAGQFPPKPEKMPAIYVSAVQAR